MTTEIDLTRYVCEGARERIKHGRHVYVGEPTRDGCGAVVRLVGDAKIGGSWLCPLCGCEYPYAFWKVRHEPDQRRVRPDELILALGEGACETCGESTQPCRCERRRQAEGSDSDGR